MKIQEEIRFDARNEDLKSPQKLKLFYYVWV